MGAPRLLGQPADVFDQRVDLLGRELVLERLHLLLDAVLLAGQAVFDRLLDLLVGELLLERGRRHVAYLHLLAFLGVSLAVLAVAGRALGAEHAIRRGVVRRGDGGTEERHREEEHGAQPLHGCDLLMAIEDQRTPCQAVSAIPAQRLGFPAGAFAPPQGLRPVHVPAWWRRGARISVSPKRPRLTNRVAATPCRRSSTPILMAMSASRG